MPQNFLAFFGHLNIDVVMRVPELPCKGSVNILRHQENYGGTAGNFAMVAASLGVPFHIFSAVSPESHRGYLQFLSSRGIDISHVYRGGDYGPVCYSATNGQDQVYYVYQGPMSSSFSGKVLREGEEYRYVHIGTGPPEDYIEVAESMKGTKVFDPGQELSYRYSREILMRFFDVADMVILNELEFHKAQEISGSDAETLKEKIPLLIVTGGSKGSRIFRDSEEIIVKAVKPERIYDTIGAGDAFRAGLYLGLYRGMDVVESAAIGSIVAGNAVSQPIVDFRMSGREAFESYRKIGESLMTLRKD